MKPIRLNLRIAVTLIAISFMVIKCSSENKSSNQSTPGLTDTQAVATDQAALDITDFTFTGTDNATNLTQDFVVPVTGANGTTISWVSDNPAVSIAADGTVTVTQPSAGGDITVTLTATVSRNGTDAVPVTFQVVVISADVVPPLLSSVTISSNNLDPTLAKAGDTITLNITASEPITTPLVTIAGVTATVSGSSSMYTASMVVQATDLQGSSAINISAFSDAAGNAGNTVTATTDGSFVNIDTAAPANQNSVLTVSSTVTGGSQIAITAAGAGNSVWFAPAGTTQFLTGSNMTTADGTATSIAAPSAAGTYLLYIVDSSGNISAPSGATVTVDNTAPIAPASLALFSPVFSPGNNTTPAIQIGGVTSGDTIQLFTDSTCTATIASGVATGTIINLTTSPLTEGSYTFYAHAVDVAGNVSPCSTASVSYLLDLTPPLLSSVTISSNNLITAMAKAGDTITLNITASEPITTPLVTIAGVTATVTGSASMYTASMVVFSADPQGSAVINIAFSDAAGNAGNTVTTTTDGSFVTIDTAAPSAPTATGLGALAISSSRIDLSWTDAIDNISAPANLVYQVCQSTVSGGCSDASFAVLATTVAGALSYPAMGLTTFTQYFFKVRAIDEPGNIGLASTEFSSTTLGIAPTVSYTGSPFSFHVNWAIVPQVPTLTGNPPTTCTSSPALPTGLSIDNTTCAISGTPTVTQVATDYVITATNAFGSGQATINVTIGAAPTVSYTGSPFSFTQNSTITTIIATLGGNTPTSCTANPSLPAGLSIDNTTCAISGTPTALQGATDYTITATNAFGSGQTTVNITVGAAPTVSYTGSPFSYPVNSAITTISPTLTGNPPTSCTAAPSLPAGLAIDAVTCAISGTPTAAQEATNHVITATNAFGSCQTTINIKVNAAPSVSYSSTPFQNGVAGNLTPTILSGGPMVSYSINPALPAGISIDPITGEISGTWISYSGSLTSHTVTFSNGNGSGTTEVQLILFGKQPQKTGLTACYDMAGTEIIGCVGTAVDGTPALGQDGQVQAGRNVNFTGPSQNATYTNDYTTSDNDSGLVWKYCVEGRSGNNCATGNMDFLTGTDAATRCNDLNALNSANGYAGLLNWRLPSLEELEAIINYGGPGVDGAAFSTYFSQSNEVPWTATLLSSNSSFRWAVDFAINGCVGCAISFSSVDINSVRCVTGSTGSRAPYMDKGDGTVLDVQTGLLWQKCSRGLNNDTTCSGTASTGNWANSLSYCNNLNLAGKTWRLPTIAELRTILDRSKSQPAIDTIYFPGTVTNTVYASSTKVFYSLTMTQEVNFNYAWAATEYSSSATQFAARCVTGP